MLRLDPGEGRIRTARSFRAWEGGGEYNVIRGLHKCFGMRTAVITAFADNEVGRLMKDFIEQGGVSTDLIYWKKTDGIGRICRNGINFTERGFGIRGAVGCSDRANTAISQATPEDFDLNTSSVLWVYAGFTQAASMQLFPSRPARPSSQHARLPRSTAPSYPMTSTIVRPCGPPSAALKRHRKSTRK